MNKQAMITTIQELRDQHLLTAKQRETLGWCTAIFVKEIKYENHSTNTDPNPA